MLGQKSIDCLIYVGMPRNNEKEIIARDKFFDEICQRYSEKPVIRKIEELERRGYVEFPMNCRGIMSFIKNAWLTDLGEQMLEESLNSVEEQ